MEDDEIFTELHNQKLREAFAILEKHFDSFLVVVEVVSHDTKKSTERISYLGTASQALGLLDLGRMILNKLFAAENKTGF